MKTVFVNGRVAVVIRYWEQRGKVTEVGARVDIRKVEQVEGPGHRAGAAGMTIAPVGGGGGIWRADLLVNLDDGLECFHYHPEFKDDDVGERFDEPQLQDDPRGWMEGRLRNLPEILEDAGAGDLIASIDLDELDRAVPLMMAAIESALERIPTGASET